MCHTQVLQVSAVFILFHYKCADGFTGHRGNHKCRHKLVKQAISQSCLVKCNKIMQ